MYPKLKIESGSLSINGECIEEIPYRHGVQWKANGPDFTNGNLYKFKLDVNGDIGNLIISDEILKTFTSNSEFRQLLISELNFQTSFTDFSIIIKDVYKFWLEMP